MDEFEQFWNLYPNQTGIGAAKSCWAAQIFFHGANPEQIIKATKAFRIKHESTEKKFIPRPSKYLQDQTYLDPDLQIEIVDKSGPWEFWSFWKPEQINGTHIYATAWQIKHITEKKEFWFELAKKLGYTIELKEKPPVSLEAVPRV
jgi:hypothetical protein